MDELKELEKKDRLWDKVEELYSEVSEFDDGVKNYFDLESDENLEKKIKVLNALIKGKTPDKIGKDYFDILELFDQDDVRDGTVAMVGDWEFDPEKYK